MRVLAILFLVIPSRSSSEEAVALVCVSCLALLYQDRDEAFLLALLVVRPHCIALLT